VKILNNLQRAAEKTGKPSSSSNTAKQLNSKHRRRPKNRRGNDYEDENGSYSYYTFDGEPFADFETIEEAEYRILEHGEDLNEYTEQETPDCPELEDHDREGLEAACLYREENGFCTALETPCVLQDH